MQSTADSYHSQETGRGLGGGVGSMGCRVSVLWNERKPRTLCLPSLVSFRLGGGVEDCSSLCRDPVCPERE